MERHETQRLLGGLIFCAWKHEDTKDIIEQIRSKFWGDHLFMDRILTSKIKKKTNMTRKKGLLHLLDYVVDGRFIYDWRPNQISLAVSINVLNKSYWN